MLYELNNFVLTKMVKELVNTIQVIICNQLENSVLMIMFSEPDILF